VIALATYELPCIAEKSAPCLTCFHSFGGGINVTLLRTIPAVAGFTRGLSVPCLRTASTIIRVRSIAALLVQHYVRHVRRKAGNTARVGQLFGQEPILFGSDTSQSIDSEHRRDERG
jgi:hypothetical protein